MVGYRRGPAHGKTMPDDVIGCWSTATRDAREKLLVVNDSTIHRDPGIYSKPAINSLESSHGSEDLCKF